ncbi:aminotransferase class III-fold pyridoxal phosphate-dependent enzyme [Pusillimonas caeni]|nr:aminotransferase class III-fold pyridoxal phosphate-dependent enzyme [Pusillimonas caeni]
MAQPYIKLVVAYSSNRVIGRDNDLPWRLPSDLAHFKRSTMGQPILMGRKTWESLGRPLPGRPNLVVSRDRTYVAEGARVFTSLADALAACGDEPSVCIIGGAQIFTEALPLADEIIATEIHADVEGDVFFPPLADQEWQEKERRPQPEENGYRYDFVVYRRQGNGNDGAKPDGAAGASANLSRMSGPPAADDEASQQGAPELSHLWMPFTANRQFKQKPRLLSSAQGMYYTDVHGRRILDGTAGLWCVNAGHGRPEIVEAIARQAAQMDYAPGFQMGHPQAFAAASAVARIMPQQLDRIFFTNSGSESVDTALKIALAYHRSRGEGQRTRFIGRERGYHGVGFGGISVGGITANRKVYSGALLPAVDHLPHTHDLQHNAFSRGQPQWGAHLADELERLVALHDPSTIAAVIVEPLAGSAGVLVPPEGYLEKLRDVTARHGILLIFDEVITGFGRLGAATASAHFGITPDLITLAKGLSNAAVPCGAVAVHRNVHDTIVGQAAEGIELFHGYTYSGHPLAAAAIRATLDIYERERLFERAAKLSPSFEQAAHSLRGARHVADVRNLGLVAGIELQSREGAPGARAAEAFQACYDRGVLLRYTGDTLALSPPLIIEESQIDQLFGTLKAILDAVA